MKRFVILIGIFALLSWCTASAQIIIQEGFEGGVIPPSGWTHIQNNPYSWEIDTYPVVSGSYSAFCYYDPTYSGNQNEYLVTPGMNFSGLSGAYVSFWWNMSYYWGMYPYNNYDCNIVVSTDGGSTWSAPIWTEATHGAFTNWIWYQATVDLSTYHGQADVRVAFNYTGYDGASLNIDDVEIGYSSWIDLLSFQGVQGRRGIRLTWSTGAEIDCLGFNLVRVKYNNDNILGDPVKVNKQMIVAQGSAHSGAEYTFIDRSLRSPGTYQYVLQEVTTSGSESDVGTVDVFFGLQPKSQ